MASLNVWQRFVDEGQSCHFCSSPYSPRIGRKYETGIDAGLYGRDQVAQIMSVVGPIFVALDYISLCSLFGEPGRRNFNAIMIAGAGAAYSKGVSASGSSPLPPLSPSALSGGSGPTTGSASDGCYIPAGTCRITSTGNPIVPFVADSSFACAVCDPVIALWCFAQAPSVHDLLRRRKLEEPNPTA
jgi:hypothetical protein